ncbi:LysR family transcriptional regulator [Vibrio maerlii]|uniref:LysR family transcriptional regulator n=1 Tax=Vibrio maerlii TaxID=2231648 RepID=UPI000E3C2032|nr:LysR family transcriptional regulator [Vibrio maerlii]
MANWEGVTEFVAVAETQSFTAAANKLNTSVAQISRRVSNLESRLAIKLFNRTTRKVSLTEPGLLYFEQCKQLVEGLELAELAVTQMQTVPKGLIKITAPVTFGEQKIAPLLNQFLLLYPEIDLDINFTNQKLDLIDQGVDVAIRLGQLEDSSMMAKKLAERQLYVCGTPSYLESFGEPHTLSELSHHQCLGGTIEHWRFKNQGRTHSLKVSGRMKCNSGITLLDAALSSLGLVQLPDYYVRAHIESGQLVEVLSQYKDDREGVWAVYPPNRNLSPKVRALIDFLAESLTI